MVTAFLTYRALSLRASGHPQALAFFALGAAGHRLRQGLPLPAAERDTLGTSYVALAGPSGELAHTFCLKSGRVFLAGGGQAAGS